MLTIFSIPKPFLGHINVIQRNAVKSWLQLKPKCEIFLFGDDEGVQETAEEFGIRHFPDIRKNEFGTPLVSDLFEQAAQKASKRYLCYLNCDILLTNTFLESVSKVIDNFEKFLAIGLHWRLDVTAELNFDDGWEIKIRKEVEEKGKRGTPYSKDYFVFPREIDFNMLPFAVGRPWWDSWLVYKARILGVPVIDMSEMAYVVHQNHDYSHVPQRSGKRWGGPEAEFYRILYKFKDEGFGMNDATHLLTEKGLKRALGLRHFRRYVDAAPIFWPWTAPLFWPIKAGITITRPLRMKIRRIRGVK